ncbi:MAG: hypothetical protein Q6365_015405, partial [Candidatus Sigynarchaeota archaeon]
MSFRSIPAAGTPSKEFILEDFLPDSWNIVKESLTEFVFNESKEPLGQMIRGEWGTGKTYLALFLNNLLQEKGIKATIVPVPMGMLYKVYAEDARFKKFRANYSHTSDLVFGAIFIAAFDKKSKLMEDKE